MYIALPKAKNNESNRQTLVQVCFQQRADRGHISDLLLLWSSPHHILFLIGQPCNPVWHKDGCSCWLWANSEQNKDESTFRTFSHPLWTIKHTNTIFTGSNNIRVVMTSLLIYLYVISHTHTHG